VFGIEKSLAFEMDAVNFRHYVGYLIRLQVGFLMSPEQCKAARALLRMEQEDLANAAGVARSTVIDFEKGERKPRQASITALRGALEAAGIQFIPENGGGAGVRLAGKKG
jgi:DNA-binding transcriptional regulator YiaG